MWYHHWLALALAGAERREVALDKAARAEELAVAMVDGWENRFVMQTLVEVCILVGEHETAIQMIERLRASSTTLRNPTSGCIWTHDSIRCEAIHAS
jgi:hypothetical protein